MEEIVRQRNRVGVAAPTVNRFLQNQDLRVSEKSVDNLYGLHSVQVRTVNFHRFSPTATCVRRGEAVSVEDNSSEQNSKPDSRGGHGELWTNGVSVSRTADAVEPVPASGGHRAMSVRPCHGCSGVPNSPAGVAVGRCRRECRWEA